MKTQALLAAPIVPTLARLSAPGVLLVLFQSMVSVGDTYFVGRLGTEALAGLALVFPLIMLLQMTSAGAMGGGVSSAIARALGSGDAVRARRLVVHALVIANGKLQALRLSPTASPVFHVHLHRGRIRAPEPRRQHPTVARAAEDDDRIVVCNCRAVEQNRLEGRGQVCHAVRAEARVEGSAGRQTHQSIFEVARVRVRKIAVRQ